MAGYYDPNIDYSLAIRNATDQATIERLQRERQNKIDDMYGGKDPYTTATVNKVTGQATTPTNTSAAYGSTWNPQTATANSSEAYRGVQSVVNSGGTASQESITASNVKNTDPGALAAANARAPQNVGISSVYDKANLAPEQVSEIEWLSKLAQDARAGGTPNSYFHDRAEEIRAQRGYSGGAMGDEYIPLKKEIPQVPQAQTTYAPGTMKSYLDQWLSAAQQQQTGKIDYATQQAIAELMRTKSDADAAFQEQRDQIAVEEAKAKDNQALYAERRGDRGGIGQAQYDIIMATAAQNRLAVNQAQTKLAADTARQISDLRAQGEFEKADALLELSQTYLSQLMALEQWAAEYNLSAAQFNASLYQWQQEFDMAVAGITGYYNGQPTLQNQQWQQEFNMSAAGLTGYYNGQPTIQNQQWQTELALNEKATLAEQGWMFLKAGIPPTESQLAAMGMTSAQAQNYLTELKIQNAAKQGDGGGNDSSVGDIYAKIFDSGAVTADDAWAYLVSNGYKSQPDVAAQLAEQYEEKYNSGSFHDSITWSLMQKGYDMPDPTIWNNSRTVTDANGNKVTQIYVAGSGWLDLSEVEVGVRAGKLDVVPNVKKNQITIMEGVLKG